MHRHHRYIYAPFELENGRQFHPCQVFHDVKHGLFICRAAGNVRITFLARQHDQAEGFNLLPEGFVVHRLKPLNDIIYVFEFHNELIVADRLPTSQILSENQGNPICPA